MIKLVVTDLDGTLLDDNKNLGAGIWDIAARLAQKGIIFSVASGRQFAVIQRMFAPIAAGMLFIADNGACVVHKNRELFTDSLDPADARVLLKIGRAIPGAFPILCGKNHTWVEDDDERFIAILNDFFDRHRLVDDLAQVDDTIMKITMLDPDDVVKNVYPRFEQHAQRYRIIPSEKRLLDISTPTASKGAALRRVQRLLGVAPGETLVFGDYLNDLEMMAVAAHSYAMKNAHPEVLKAAKFVTEHDNNHQGVERTIRKLCLGET